MSRWEPWQTAASTLVYRPGDHEQAMDSSYHRGRVVQYKVNVGSQELGGSMAWIYSLVLPVSLSLEGKMQHQKQHQHLRALAVRYNYFLLVCGDYPRS